MMPVILPWTANQIATNWAVFTVSDATQVLWIGCNAMQNLLDFSEFTGLPWWQAVKDQPLTITINATFATEQDARRYQFEYRRDVNPPGNRQFIARIENRNYGAVRCVDTGEIFRNAAEAARRIGVHTSTMSNHMTGRPGYEKVKGMTYERIRK